MKLWQKQIIRAFGIIAATFGGRNAHAQSLEVLQNELVFFQTIQQIETMRGANLQVWWTDAYLNSDGEEMAAFAQAMEESNNALAAANSAIPSLTVQVSAMQNATPSVAGPGN